MPMHHTSTSHPKAKSSNEANRPSNGPSAKTIAFLKQFARAYTYLPASKPQLAGFIAN